MMKNVQGDNLDIILTLEKKKGGYRKKKTAEKA